jgi:hypothetical protein
VKCGGSTGCETKSVSGGSAGNSISGVLSVGSGQGGVNGAAGSGNTEINVVFVSNVRVVGGVPAGGTIGVSGGAAFAGEFVVWVSVGGYWAGVGVRPVFVGEFVAGVFMGGC